MTRRRYKLSRYKQLKLLEMFVGDVPARTVAGLAGVNRHSSHAVLSDPSDNRHWVER